MEQPPNAKNLQEIVYILYYMCRRGRENLRNMKKDTFAVKTDPDDQQKRQYIYQVKDECDKNHKEANYSASNYGKIFEIPGKFNHQNLQFLKPCLYDNFSAHRSKHLTV